jgi:PPIC-type PPIASE domain
MSSAVPPPPEPIPASDSPRTRSWLREPLLHFVVLGGLLFAGDYLLHGRAGDPHSIVVGADVNKDLTEMFVAGRQRPPTPQELKGLQQAWLDNEVLYREGISLALDKGDPMIRDRVIFKLLGVVETGVKVQTPDEKTLRAWYDAHPDKYQEQPRFSFEEAALVDTGDEAKVRAFVKELRAGTPGDAQAGLRVFKNRPVASIDEAYGVEFTKALAALPANEWTAVPTRDGWRAIRVTGSIPASSVDFQAHRLEIIQDWRDATASDQRTAAVRAIAKKYKIRYETATP